MIVKTLMRRLSPAVVVLGLATSGAAMAQDGGALLGNILNSVAGSGIGFGSNADTGRAGAPAARGLTETPKAAEAGPLAWVDDISGAPGAGVDVADMLTAGQTIDLGRRGTVRIGYFDTCRMETVKGGRVVVTAGGSAVEGGKVSVDSVACSSSAAVVSASASEAATAAKRATPFVEKTWYEAAMKTRTPLIRWDGTGKATIRVTALESEVPKVVWTKTTGKDRITYGGPRLVVGMPYLAEVTVGSKVYSGLFSYDPGLDANDALHRVVVLRD